MGERFSPATLASLALPSIFSNAAQPVADLAVTAMLARTTSRPTVAVAAYALALSTVNFASNVFNFLLSVTMSEVGRAVGARRWGALAHAIRVALGAAAVSSALCVAVVLLSKEQIYAMFDAEESVREEADAYIGLRLATVPLLFVGRVVSSVLVGFQRIRLVAVVNTLQAVAGAAGSWVALDRYGAGLRGVGLATLVAATAGCATLLAAVTALPPADSPNRVRWWACCDGDGDHCDDGDGSAPPQNGVRAAESPLLEHASKKRGGQGAANGGRSTLAGAAVTYLRQSGDMMVRSIMLQGALFATYVVASRELGTEALTAHQVIAQLWGLTSYICDGFADVGTMLGSRLIGEGHPAAVRRLSRQLLGMGLGVAAAVVAVLAGLEPRVQGAFSKDPPVLRLLRQNWALLVAMQPVNAAVFVTDGVLIAFGPPAFRFVRNLMLFGACAVFAPCVALAVEVFRTLLALWAAKNLLTVWRCACALWFVECRPLPEPCSTASSRDGTDADAETTETAPLLGSTNSVADTS